MRSDNRSNCRRAKTYLGPDSGLVVERRDTEGLERSQDNKHGGPAVVKRERQVDKELVGNGAGRVMFLDNIVDVGNGGANQERKDEGCVGGGE